MPRTSWRLALHRIPDCAWSDRPTSRPYLTDTGYEGRERHQRWAEAYGAIVLALTRNDRCHAWPRVWRPWYARMRQIVEVVPCIWTGCFDWMTSVRILRMAFRRSSQPWPHCTMPVSG